MQVNEVVIVRRSDARQTIAKANCWRLQCRGESTLIQGLCVHSNVVLLRITRQYNRPAKCQTAVQTETAVTRSRQNVQGTRFKQKFNFFLGSCFHVPIFCAIKYHYQTPTMSLFGHQENILRYMLNLSYVVTPVAGGPEYNRNPP